MFFYELHEGDNEVFADVLVASEAEMEPEEFFELVQSIRRRIQDTFEHDTLSRGDRRSSSSATTASSTSATTALTAAVNVSTEDEENFLADLESTWPTRRTTSTMTTIEDDDDAIDFRRSSSTSTRAAA